MISVVLPSGPTTGIGSRPCAVQASLAVTGALIVAGAGLPSLGGHGSSSARGATTCGVERWAVKTLSDPKVGDVNFAPHDTSIGRLRNKPDPHTKSSTPRLDGVETTTATSIST
jgi:hypothetical protein